MNTVMDNAEATQKTTVPPIGQLLVVGEFIVPQDLEFALEHQKNSKELIGEILVRMGALTPKDLEIVLRTQKLLLPR